MCIKAPELLRQKENNVAILIVYENYSGSSIAYPDNNIIKLRHVKAMKQRACEYRAKQTAELSFYLCCRYSTYAKHSLPQYFYL